MATSAPAMQAANAPDINIICEKVAFDGVTRFEDRYRLPLGVTVNITDYSAQMATEVCPLQHRQYSWFLTLGHRISGHQELYDNFVENKSL